MFYLMFYLMFFLMRGVLFTFSVFPSTFSQVPLAVDLPGQERLLPVCHLGLPGGGGPGALCHPCRCGAVAGEQ